MDAPAADEARGGHCTRNHGWHGTGDPPQLRESMMSHPVTTPKKPGLGRSLVYALTAAAALPVAIAILWALGAGTSKATGLISRTGISWHHTGLGAGVMVGFAILVGAIHTARAAAARRAERAERYASVIANS